MNNKKIRLLCKHGDDLIYSNDSTNNTNANNNEESKDLSDHEVLKNKYASYTKSQLDNEFNRIASIPNARTNVECLKQMSALMEVYESKGIQMPSNNTREKVKPKSGCMSLLLLLVIAIGAIMLNQ